MEQGKRTTDRFDQRTGKYQSRADILREQIAELKLHFERELKSCGDSQMEKLYISSAKTLESMERMLLESEEHRVWRENARTFLV